MKLLIKIYFPDVNSYELEHILEFFYKNISDNYNTKTYVMTNDPNNYEHCYLKDTKIQNMINHNLNDLHWDIVIPLIRPTIPTNSFDTDIMKIYTEKFPNLDGVLWLSDGVQDEINTYPVIGRKYYEKFNWIYNPVYNKKNFEKEFSDIMKLSNSYHFVDTVFFNTIDLKLDDDNIYELRKKVNFGIV